MSQKTSTSISFKVSGDKPALDGPSYALDKYVASTGNVIDRLQTGHGGLAANIEKVQKLKEEVDALAKIIRIPRS